MNTTFLTRTESFIPRWSLKERLENYPLFLALMRKLSATVLAEWPDEPNLCFWANQLKETCDSLEECYYDLNVAVELFGVERIVLLKAENGRYTDSQWNFLVELCGDKCVLCGVPRLNLVGKCLTKDHVISQRYKDRTSDCITNLQPLCQRCNSRKRFLSGLEGVDLVPASVRRRMKEKFNL